MSECPSDDDLVGFLNESLPPDRVGRLSTHVDTCHACQTRLDKLTHDVDGAVARYKELSSISPSGKGMPTSSPEAGTMIIGVDPLPPVRLAGLPSVPGFDVLQEIGRGGMGVVYKARHRRLNRLVALKMVLAGCSADTRAVQRFLFEAEILARVQHPQVVQVFEVDVYQGPSGVPIPYLAMELLEGGSLARRLREQAGGAEKIPTDEKRGPLEPRAAAELMEGIARAVHVAHLQGIVHRDLKPGNILFSVDRGPWTVDSPNKPASSGSLPTARSSLPTPGPKVTDFGLAKFTEASSDLTGSGQVVGTPQYVSPEQAVGSREIGPATDVYALGAILFECLAGRPPFQGGEPMSVLLKVVNEAPPDVRTLCPALHRDLGAVVMKCLAKDPRRRYPSAIDFADDLRRYLENRPTRARPVTTRERTWLWVKRNPAVAGLMATLATVLLVAFVAITALWWKAEQTALDERHASELLRLSETRVRGAYDEAASALEEARRQKTNADLQQANLEFARAVTWCDDGRVSDGLDSFVRVVEVAEQIGAKDLARVARMNLASWPRELPTIHRAIAHSHQPRYVAFFPDGRRAVVAARGGSMFLWNVATDQKALTYRSSLQFARGLTGLTMSFQFWTSAISPDGKTVVGGASDGQVWVWDVDRMDPRTTLAAAPVDQDVWGIGFAPNGTLWATDGGTGIQCWDLVTRKSITRGNGSADRRAILQSLIVSSDGKRLFTGDRQGMIREWDADKATPRRSWEAKGWVTDLALSPDDNQLAATGTDGLVRVIDLTSGDPIHKFSLSGAYGNGVAFAPNRPLLIASDGDGNVRVWDRTTGVPVGVPVRLSGEVLRPRFAPNSDEFAVAAGDAVYHGQLADPPGQLLSAAEGIRVRGLDFTPTGDKLAVAFENQLDVFDPRKGVKISSHVRWNGALTIRYDPEPTRNRLIRGTRDGFDAIVFPDGRADALRSSNERIGRIGFTPGGGMTFTMGSKQVSRWDSTTFRRQTAQFVDPDLPVGVEFTGLEVRPDGGELLVSYANKIVFLDPNSFQKSRPGISVADEVLDVKYLPGGTRLLVARRDSVAQVLDAATGTPLGPPMTHARAVTSVAVSSDGQVLLTGSRDGTARFWDTATGLPLGPPLRHAGPVTHVGWNPKGNQVATGTGSGDVLLWSPPPPPVTGPIEELRKKG